MNKWVLGFVAVCVVLTAPPVHARQSIGELLADCSSVVVALDTQGAPKDGLSAGYCLGYLEGVADDVRVSKASDPGVVICIPEGVTPGQLARVFVKYARAKPETHHEDKLLGVLSAFASAFRCRPPE